MKIINRTLSGKLNLDTDNLRMPPQDYVDALNVTRNNKDILFNVVGNELVDNPYLSLIGENKRIGTFPDLAKNRIYIFIWNSDGYHLICYYDDGTGTFTKLILSQTDSGGDDILQFNPSYRINHIDIIYRDEGDIISWTDGNVSPKEFNVDTITSYGTIEEAFIEAAKRPPLDTPTATYGDDATKNNNSMRKTLFRFKYRWQQDDFTLSSPSSYSELALPVTVGTDNDLDPTKNNFIAIGVSTGAQNVTAIEIAMQQLVAGVWSDFVLVTHLIKSEIGIADDGTYVFNFYNDGVYPAADQNEWLLTYDYFPKKAYTQCLPNGNVKVYGALTEGYPRYPVNELDVVMDVELIKNSGVSLGDPSFTYMTSGASNFIFTVSGAVYTGAVYNVVAFIFGTGVITLSNYTAIIGDTTTNVASGLYASTSPTYASSTTLNTYYCILPAGSYIINISVTGGSAGTTITTQSTWNYNSKYRFGIVYKDKWGYIIGDVCSYVSQAETTADFEINTPNFEQDSGIPKTPVISAEVNHLPPTGAVTWMWCVTKNLSLGSFLYYITCDFQSDADYYYFCLANVGYFNELNDKFVHDTATVTDGSRLKVMCNAASGTYSANYYTLDFEVLGSVERLLTGGVNPADLRSFVKVKKPLAAPSPAMGINMLVCLYEPVKHVDSGNLNVYYEFGPSYDIYEDSGVMYHRGQLQDQTASQPATFQFVTGDIYYHDRLMYYRITAASVASATSLIMDANFNDFYSSAVNGYGRPQIINVDARESYNPTMVRFSQEFQQGTNINGVNRFYQLNYDEYDRSNGSIRKMFIEGRKLYIFQEFETGVVPVLIQIIKDTSGNPLEANSDILLNKISYPYLGKHGIGDTPESFAYSKGAKYFLDSHKAQLIRLSQDGATVISLVYECNQFFVDTTRAYGKGLDNGIVPAGQVYKGNPTVYGVYDAADNKYILNFEEIRRYSDPTNLTFSQDAVSINFYEVRSEMEGFESKLSYHSEGMIVFNNLLASFKDGQLWKHNSALYCNFYGVQYEAYVTICFNDNATLKKTFMTVGYEGNQFWVSDTNGDVLTSQPNQQTNLPQISQLKSVDYEINEGHFDASFLQDVNSMTDPILALVTGDSLKGVWVQIKFKFGGSDYAWLNIPQVGYVLSPKNAGVLR